MGGGASKSKAKPETKVRSQEDSSSEESTPRDEKQASPRKKDTTLRDATLDPQETVESISSFLHIVDGCVQIRRAQELTEDVTNAAEEYRGVQWASSLRGRLPPSLHRHHRKHYKSPLPVVFDSPPQTPPEPEQTPKTETPLETPATASPQPPETPRPAEPSVSPSPTPTPTPTPKPTDREHDAPEAEGWQSASDASDAIAKGWLWANRERAKQDGSSSGSGAPKEIILGQPDDAKSESAQVVVTQDVLADSAVQPQPAEAQPAAENAEQAESKQPGAEAVMAVEAKQPAADAQPADQPAAIDAQTANVAQAEAIGPTVEQQQQQEAEQKAAEEREREAKATVEQKEAEVRAVHVGEVTKLLMTDSAELAEFDEVMEGLDWLKKAMRGTIETKEWNGLREQFVETLKRFIDKNSNTQQVQQCAFEIVGSNFVQRHYPRSVINPSLLRPPFMIPQVYEALRARLRTECFQFVAAKIESLGHSPDYVQYKAVARDAIMKATEQLCSPPAQTQPQALQPLDSAMNAQTQTPTATDGKRTMSTLLVSDVKTGKETKADVAGSPKRDPNSTPLATTTVIDAGASHEQREREKTVLLASAFVGLCRHNPSLHAKFAQLRSLVLPAPLRQYVWSLALRNEDTMIKCVREAKQRAEVWNTTDLAKSPIHSLIDKLLANVLKFQQPLARDATTPAEAKAASAVLNCYYLASERYGFRESVLASHLVRVFPSEPLQSLTAMFAHLLEHCLPPPGACKTMASSVLARVDQRDRELSSHLFAVFSQTISLAQVGARGLPLPTKPVALIERWLEHAFVGFLRPQLVDLVWDQLFLADRLDASFLADVALELLLSDSFRSSLMAARTPLKLDELTVSGLLNLDIARLQTIVRRLQSPAQPTPPSLSAGSKPTTPALPAVAVNVVTARSAASAASSKPVASGSQPASARSAKDAQPAEPVAAPVVVSARSPTPTASTPRKPGTATSARDRDRAPQSPAAQAAAEPSSSRSVPASPKPADNAPESATIFVV